MSFQRQSELEAQYLMPTFGRYPVQFVEGRGMKLIDADGKEYIDFLSGIGVVSLGHCHPAVVDAVEAQARKLLHVGNYFYVEHRGEVARLLSDLLEAEIPESDKKAWKTFFANSGAEANECAIKLARLHARKRAVERGGSPDRAPRLIVTLQRSFHGRTLATLSATAQPAKQEAFKPLPEGFVATPINDVEALEALFAERGSEICAVLVECVQGEAGVYPCTVEFLQAVRRLTASHEALFMCDEVQCGIFRTGKPFGYQHYGVAPDVVTMAKGIASGFPAGACAARGDVADTFAAGDHGSTFGGSSLAVAAMRATLEALSDTGVSEHVCSLGAYLRESLSSIPQVGEVRGLGLMVGVDLDPRVGDAHDVVADALAVGLVLNAPGPRTLRFLPPLICEKGDIDVLVERLGAILARRCS